MMLENDMMTDNDRMLINKCLMKLKTGILHNLPPRIDIDTGIRNIFKQFDRDGSGKITINELHALCIAVGVPIERKYTLSIMKRIDKDNNALISLDELKDYIIGRKQIN